MESKLIEGAVAAEGGVAGGVLVGIEVAKTLMNAAAKGFKMVYTAGGVVHNWLKEAMPLDSKAHPIEKEDFPPFKAEVSKDLEYKINVLKDTAEALGSPAAYSMAKGIIDQINEEVFTVLFVGCFNTGKSALLNKLLKQNILETGGVETTKTLAWLWYGENNKAWYHDYADDLHCINLENIATIPKEPPVFNVFASVNADILKNGVVLIDTPGLGASGETQKLTDEAMGSADAVILLVNHYPVGALDQEIIEKLKKTGKADSLFVVMNQMDMVSDEDRVALLEERRNWLSKLGIRTEIYPLSHTNNIDILDDDFKHFHEALKNRINKQNLQSARDTSVTQRIKNTAAFLNNLCEDAAKAGKDPQERRRRLENDKEKMEKTKQKIEKYIQDNKYEIMRLKESVLLRWGDKINGLKNETYTNIQNATDAQLQQPNQILGNIESEVNKFLLGEFYAAEDQIRNNTIKSFTNVQSPALQQEGRMSVAIPGRWDTSLKNIPPEFGTFGLLAFTFLTKAHGFFSTIACLPSLFMIFVMSPFINKIFEQVLKAIGVYSTAAFKTKLLEKINEQWNVVDDNVKQKINGFFSELSNQLESHGRENIRQVTNEYDNLVKVDSINNAKRAEEFEILNQKLKGIE
jgi:GTP-binding protein EngB required for normal cell division